MRILLVQQPHIHPGSIYLPLQWGLFKTYMEVNYEHKLEVEWLDPLYMMDDEVVECDLLLLSCYVWNFEQNLQHAKRAKELNPNCLVVAGGPEIPYKRKEVFDLYPNIDIIALNEGERLVSEIVYRLQNNLTLDIPGLITKETIHNPIRYAEKINLSECISPYIHCFDDMKRFVRQAHEKGKRVICSLETNRGCPYACSFCDWGSDTNSKIRAWPEKMMLEALEHIIQLQPNLVFINDSNYGSFERDYKYIKKLAEGKQKTGYPQIVTFQSAKNNKKYVNKCYKVLYDNGMVMAADMSFQHTDPEVLANIERSNISTQKLILEMEESFNLGIPMTGTLICGNPGDTLDKWKSAWNDLLVLGFHDVIKVYDFHLIENSPANEPAYKEKFKIKTLRKRQAEQVKDRNLYDADIIVESYSFDIKDYVSMQAYTALIQGVHNLNIVRFIALALYHNKGYSYKDFYNDFMKIPVIKNMMDDLESQIEDYINTDLGIKFAEYNGEKCLYEEYVYLSCLDNIDEIYTDLKIYLKNHFEEDLVEDLINFNYNMVTGLHANKQICLSYKLDDYFKKILTMPPNTKYDGEIVKKGIIINITDRRLGVDKNIDFDKITDKKTLKTTLLKNSNFRHRMSYFPSVFFE